MSEKRLKINIDYHIVGDGRKFLNFWNYHDGNDIICEIKDKKLMFRQYLKNGLKLKEITIFEFLRLIEDKFN